MKQSPGNVVAGPSAACSEPRPTVLLWPGPIHLFWTQGVYYLYELGKLLDVVLVVDDVRYRSDAHFERVRPWARAVVEVPSAGTVFGRHRHYARTARDLVRCYRPAFVFQANHVYPLNIYLFREARRCGAWNISYQNSMEHTSKELEWSAERAIRYSQVHQRLHNIVPMPAVIALSRLKGRYDYYLNAFALPFLIEGEAHNPPFDVHTKTVRTDGRQDYYDYRLVYSEADKQAARSENAAHVLCIRDPRLDNGADTNRLLYGRLKENQDTVLILPPFGLAEQVALIGGRSSVGEAVQSVSVTWIRAIKVLRERFPGFPIRLKPHPNERSGAPWTSVLELLRAEIPEIEVLDRFENPFPLIIESRVVVSEISTVLYWAKLLNDPRKLLVSLDLFNSNLGYMFAEDPHVYYFQSVEEVQTCAFDRQIPKLAADGQSLVEFLADLQARRRPLAAC